MHRLIRGASPLAILGSVLIIALQFTLPMKAWCDERVTADTITLSLRDAVYGHSLSEADLYNLHSETLTDINRVLGDNPEAYRARALAHYYVGRWHQAIKTRQEMEAYAATLREKKYLSLRRYYTEKEPAMGAYRIARTEAESYLDAVPSAEAHRLYGEILGQMLFLGDVGDVLSIGKKARRNVQKALKKDPRLIKALIQEASRMAYTPLSYGGDPDVARTLYREILRYGSEDREDLFNIYGGFAMAAFVEGKDDEALSWFEEASTIYPGNIFAAGMADFLKKASL